MKTLKAILFAAVTTASLSILHANNQSELSCADIEKEMYQEAEVQQDYILVEVDYIIDAMGKPHVTYINSNDYDVNQRVINMIEQAEWPVRKHEVETVHSMVISLQY